MGSFSPIHWLIVAVVILLLFGPSRLAGAGKGLGEGIRNFKKGLGGDDDDDKKTTEGSNKEAGQLNSPQETSKQ